MRVSCPNCSTQYEVPDAALAGRSRKLRCELCRHAWRTPAPELGPAPLPAWAAFPARKPGAAPSADAPAADAPPPPNLPNSAPPPPEYTPPPVVLPPVFAPPQAPPVYVPPPAAAPPLYAPPPPPAYVPPPLAAAPPPVALFPLPPVSQVAPAPAFMPPQSAPPEPLPEFDPPARVWPPQPDNLIPFPPPEARQFGKPVDASAQAEVLQAVAQEQKSVSYPVAVSPAPAPDAGPMPMPGHPAPEPAPAPDPAAEDPDRGLPTFLTAAGADETLMLTAPYAAVGGDRFAELVYAARNKAIEVEPEKPPPPPPVRTSNTPLFIALVLAFLIALTLLEHSFVEHIFPASRGFFSFLGLK